MNSDIDIIMFILTLVVCACVIAFAWLSPAMADTTAYFLWQYSPADTDQPFDTSTPYVVTISPYAETTSIVAKAVKSETEVTRLRGDIRLVEFADSESALTFAAEKIGNGWRPFGW